MYETIFFWKKKKLKAHLKELEQGHKKESVPTKKIDDPQPKKIDDPQPEEKKKSTLVTPVVNLINTIETKKHFKFWKARRPPFFPTLSLRLSLYPFPKKKKAPNGKSPKKNMPSYKFYANFIN